jgi:hypothetical protein
MKNRLRAAAVAALLVAGPLVGAVPAQAHYDPWTTHTHCNSYGCYQMCSWHAKYFMGCREGYYIVWR